MTQELLIQRCKENDRKAQELLYNTYASAIYGISLKYSKNKQEAEDNLQDCFITVFQKIKQYKSKGSFEGWMKRIAINTLLQKYRNNQYTDTLDEEKINDNTVVTIEDRYTNYEIDDLLALIQELPDRYRMVFNLYVLDNYSHKEIAAMLCISEGTSKSNLARARMILKSSIEKGSNTIPIL